MPGPPLSRRTALLSGSGAVAVALTGCGSEGTPAATSPPADAGDVALVRRAADREDQVRRDALRAAQRHPQLRAALRGAAEVHATHAALLQQASGSRSRRADPRPVPRNPGAAARALARAERSLADAHARAALDARSGPLARVLAAMAAAADQQAQVLDGLTAPPRQGA